CARSCVESPRALHRAKVDTDPAQTRAPNSGIVDLSGWWVFTPTRVGTRARVHLRRHRQGAFCQPEDRACDHETLDLARPFIDLGDLRIAEVALDRELLRKTVAAEDLDCLRRLAPGALRSEQLGLRARLPVRFALLLEPRRPVHEEARGVDLGRHVRQLPLHGLKLRNGLPELPALDRVLARGVV